MAYILAPAAIGWFAFVVVAGAAELRPTDITVPSPEIYNPYLDDFTVFYAAGTLARDGAGDEVYDVAAMHKREAEVAGQDPRQTVELPFFGPPFTLGVFAGLAVLPLGASAAVWTVIGLLSVALCAIGLARQRRGLSATTLLIWALGILAAPPFFQTLIHGQTSFFLVSGFVLLIPSVAKSGRVWPTTFGLVLIAHKPQMAILPVAYLLLVGEWRPVVRAGAVVAGLSIASMAVLGWHIAIDHIRLLVSATQWHDSNGISIWGMFGWNAFFAGLGLGTSLSRVLTIAADLTTVVVVFISVRRAGARHSLGADSRLALLIFASLLVSPHVYEHDVLLAAIPCFLLSTTGTADSKLIWGLFSCVGWVLLYFHFDLLVATSINFTVIWLTTGLILAALTPDLAFMRGMFERRIANPANAEGAAS